MEKIDSFFESDFEDLPEQIDAFEKSFSDIYDEERDDDFDELDDL